MNRPVIDQVAIWTPIGDNKVYSKTYIGRMEYLNGKILDVASLEKPLYAYANNYEKFGLKFSLFVYSLLDDTSYVLKEFDRLIKSVKKKDIQNLLQTTGYDNFRFIGEIKNG